MTRVEHPPAGSSAPRLNAQQASLAATAVPPDLSLTRRVRFAPGRVVLVTYDPDRRALKVVSPG
jgi:hypothetical protein